MEVAGYKGKDEIAPSMEEMNKLLVEKVVVKTLEEITLKNGRPAVSLYGAHTHLHMNPSGKFIIGGPQGDAVKEAGRKAPGWMSYGFRIAPNSSA